MFRKLKSLYRGLIELETELSMFEVDEWEVIDVNTQDYLDSLKARIKGYEDNIKELLCLK